LERHRGIARINQTVKSGAAGVHPSRHLNLGEVLFLRRLLNLPRERFLESHGARFTEDDFRLQEVI
jgi:hypothetical protein